MDNRYESLKKRKDKNIKKGYEIEPINEMAESYLKMRRIIGLIGFFLPIILLTITYSHNNNILPSISDYYYSKADVIFVSALTTIGFFLYAQKSVKQKENILFKVLSVFSFLIILFPTNVRKEFILISEKSYSINEIDNFQQLTCSKPEFVGYLHLFSAFLFFSFLIVMIFIKFIPEEKTKNNLSLKIILYKFCAWIMILSILCIIIIKLLSIYYNWSPETWTFPLVFTSECLCLCAFGFSWFLYGHGLELLMKDEN